MYIKDERISRNFFLMITFLYAVVFMTKNCFSVALAAIVSEGILTKSQTGLITAAFYLVYGPLQIVGGILADKYRPDRLVKFGLIGSLLANTVIFLNHNYYVMLSAWVFNGFSQLALYPALFKIITSQLSPTWRKKGIYYFSFSATLGLMLGYVIAAFVTKWQYNFLVSAVSSLMLYVVFGVTYAAVRKRMVPDETPKPQKPEAEESGISTGKLLWVSGFMLLLPVFLFRYMIDNAIKTYTPIMLLESYPQMNATASNLLNLFILVSGILGIILAKKYVFPGRMRNEVGAILFLIALAFPFTLLIKFTGHLPVWMIIVAMCMTSALLSGASLVISFYNGTFARHGKNGTAAGISNAAMSLGAILQSYGFASIADNFGWSVVTTVYLIGIVACIAFVTCALPLWTRFKKAEN